MNVKVLTKRFASEDNFQWLVVLCCLLLFTGFVCSRALASLGMIGTIVVSFLFTNPLKTGSIYFKRKELWVISLFFFIVLFSGIYSDDKTYWMNWVRIKLPFIGLPFAFASLKKITEKKFIIILYGFILAFFVSTIVVLLNYFIHFKQLTDAMAGGDGIPMPFNRIRFTLMIAFSFFCLIYLLENKKHLFSKNEKWLQLFILLFLFVSLHILSVRSSLAALYIGLFFLLIRFILQKKKYVLGALFLFLLFAVPFVAVQTIPSLQNKLSYMRYDSREYGKGNMDNLSDGMRLTSVKVGLGVTLKNCLFGVGAGDLKSETAKFYREEYVGINEKDYKLPHSQFVWVLASLGVVGFLVFLFAFFFPFFSSGIFKNFLAILFYIIIFSSFFTEATLEEQMGSGFYLIFLLLFINQAQKETYNIQSSAG